MHWLKPPPIKFWTASPYLPMRGGHSPHALNTCGKPWGVNTMKTFKMSCFDTIYNRSYLNLNPLNATGIYIRPSMVISMTTNVLHEQPWVYIYVCWLFVLWTLHMLHRHVYISSIILGCWCQNSVAFKGLMNSLKNTYNVWENSSHIVKRKCDKMKN